jgi:hypothetical protein
MLRDRQPIYSNGSLIKIKSEISLDGKNVYIDDYDKFGESIPMLGIVLMCVCSTAENSSYDVMIDGEVVRTFEHELELVEENHRREFDEDK